MLFDNMFINLPEEIIYEIIEKLPINEIYNNIVAVNNYCKQLVDNDYFCRKILKKLYPNYCDIIISINPKENLKKIHKIMNQIIIPKELKYKVNNCVYSDKTIVLPYNIIAQIFNLPKLEIMYSEIFGYLRCGEFNLKCLKNYSLDKNKIHRITLFSYVKNKKIFENYYDRERINMSFEELFSNLDPINLNNYKQFENKNQDIYAITIQISNNKKEIFYSGLNSNREQVQSLFQEVKNEHKLKYS